MTADSQQFFTRCPHCRTMFRVAPMDSDASQGWVKCGRCKKVFDSEKNKLDPSAFIKATEEPDQQKIETHATNPPLKQSPEKQNSETESTALSIKQGSESVPPKVEVEKIAASVKQSSPLSSETKKSIDLTPNQSNESTEEFQLSSVDRKQDKEIKAKQPHNPMFKTKDEDTKVDQIIEKQEPEQKRPVSTPIEESLKKPDEFRLEEKVTLPAEKVVKPLQSKNPVKSDKHSPPSLAPIKKSGATPHQALNVKAEKQRKEEKSQWTKSILAQAQSWKKEKNRFQSRRSYTSFLFAIGLLALLIWQVAIVNYTKLANYNFLAGPLNLTCAVFSCNQQQPASEHKFEILHANLRRHNAIPGVLTISANLINYSNSEKLLPNIRLDLTDADESIVASKIINLVDNPQYIDPTISQLAPGQDVKLKFDIDRPLRSAVGFEISIIN